MSWNNARAYQSAAAEGASHIGLLVLVYDGLAADLNRAAEAAREGSIPRRCEASNHALLLLGHLESWVPLLEDAALEASLRMFYATVRARMLHLQAAPDPSQFAELAQWVCGTRAAWQAKEQKALAAASAGTVAIAPDPYADPMEEPLSFMA